MRHGLALVLIGWVCVAEEEPRVLQLTDGAGASRAPRWSPDGGRIAFESDRSGDWDIYVLEVASGAVERLTESGAADRHPAWSPDGRTIVYAAIRAEGEQYQLYLEPVP